MNTDKWHEWRSQGLGSSDAPIVMGVSPWCTPYQLWEQKTKRATRDFSNWATDRGNRLEPVARALYELQFGMEAPPTLMVNRQFPFIRASLDGYSHTHGVILEIKCPGKDDHAKAVNGKVPEKYLPQLHHQLLACPSASQVHYWSFNGDKGTLVEVKRDKEYELHLFDTLCKFWKLVQEDKEPPFMERDFKKVKDPELVELLHRYEGALANMKTAQACLDSVKEKIITHPKVIGQRVVVDGQWKINITNRRGSIDYSKVQELKDVDLERYRRENSTFHTIQKTASAQT